MNLVEIKATVERKGITIPDLKKLVPYMSDFLKLYRRSRNLLYHGEWTYADPLMFIKTSRPNRIPKDTPEELQNALDKKLKQAGFEAVRGNSIFCSGSLSFVKDYGTPYAIFPLNGFDFTWSWKIEDFYELNFSTVETNLINLSPKNFCQHYEFEATDLGDAIKTGNEIYLKGTFVAIESKYFIKNKEIDEILLGK